MNNHYSLFRLDGFVAIVTGASRGIGYAIASGLSGVGATVIGLGRSQVSDVDTSSFTYKTCDVTDQVSFNALADFLFETEGRIDILINAAGITIPSKMSQDSSAYFQQTLNTNLISVFHCCNCVIPFMRQGGYGSIINVTSIGANLGFPGNPGYVASKGGLSSLTRALALDYGLDAIRVNNLVPGYIHTSMTHSSYSNPTSYEERSSRTMLRRWGRSEELIGPAIFLSSPASSYITGSELVVDGGWSAKGL